MKLFEKYLLAFVLCFVLMALPDWASARIADEVTVEEGSGISSDIPQQKGIDCNEAVALAQKRIGTGKVMMIAGGSVAAAGLILYGIDVASLDNTWRGKSGLIAAGAGIITLGTGVVLHCVGKSQIARIKCSNTTLALLPSDSGVGLKLRF